MEKILELMTHKKMLRELEIKDAKSELTKNRHKMAIDSVSSISNMALSPLIYFSTALNGARRVVKSYRQNRSTKEKIKRLEQQK